MTTGQTDSDEPDGTSTSAPVAVAPARAPETQMHRGLRVAGAALLGLLAVCLTVALVIDASVSLTTHGAVVAGVDDVPPTPVALLLGTARTHQGRPNQFYRGRIEAAAALFHSGRVRGILVSGDNGTPQYNEPIAMRKDLVALGVPADYITLDYAGFRTLDSIVRAREVFGLDRFVVVSQRFHAERAIFIARRFGIAATGLAAPDPTAPGLMKVRAREVLARSAAVLDLLTGRGPRYLGARETVRLRGDQQLARGTAALGAHNPTAAPAQPEL